MGTRRKDWRLTKSSMKRYHFFCRRWKCMQMESTSPLQWSSKTPAVTQTSKIHLLPGSTNKWRSAISEGLYKSLKRWATALKTPRRSREWKRKERFRLPATCSTLWSPSKKMHWWSTSLWVSRCLAKCVLSLDPWRLAELACPTSLISSLWASPVTIVGTTLLRQKIVEKLGRRPWSSLSTSKRNKIWNGTSSRAKLALWLFLNSSLRWTMVLLEESSPLSRVCWRRSRITWEATILLWTVTVMKTTGVEWRSSCVGWIWCAKANKGSLYSWWTPWLVLSCKTLTILITTPMPGGTWGSAPSNKTRCWVLTIWRWRITTDCK